TFWPSGMAWNSMAEKPPKRRAIVIGGSIGGLFGGAFLRRIGWQVDIYEPHQSTSSGAGSVLLLPIWNCLRVWTNAVLAPAILASLFTSASRSTVVAR